MITRPPDPSEPRGGLRAERPYLYGAWPGVALILLSGAYLTYVVGWLSIVAVSTGGLVALGLAYSRRRRRAADPESRLQGR